MAFRYSPVDLINNKELTMPPSFCRRILTLSREKTQLRCSGEHRKSKCSVFAGTPQSGGFFGTATRKFFGQVEELRLSKWH